MTRIVVQKPRQQGKTFERACAKAFQAGFVAGLFEAHDTLLKRAHAELPAPLRSVADSTTSRVLYDAARTLGDRAKEIQNRIEYEINPDDVEPGSENKNPRPR